jgi:hypothetical protein
MVAGCFLVRGELPPSVQHLPTGPAITVLFRNVPMPAGGGGNAAVPILRPPAETRPALTSLIASTPRDALLYRLRAREAEMALDFVAAESDWRTYAQTASDRYAAQIELADFYERRARPRDELAALSMAAAAGTDDKNRSSVLQQRGWRAFERMAAVVKREALGNAAAEPVFRAWVSRYPKEPSAWRKLIEHLGASRQFGVAEAEIATYGRAFHDNYEPVRMRAELAIHRGSVDAAIGTYDAAFQPLWPEEMRAAYFKLLADQGQLRQFTQKARTALESNSTDLNATARLFHYFRSQNNIAAARRALLEYRIAKESGGQPWTAAELETLAQLFEWLPDVNEAARLYYALYSVPPAGGAHTERALYGLANLLLTSPEQPIQFGSGDLSFYKDIATVDPSPGFLNGILSLVLNGTGPRWAYETQNQKSTAYFHRAAASQLATSLEQRFPRSAYRAPLRAGLIAAYGAYGDDASVIRAGREYLAAFPTGAARVSVAMHVTDALARGERTTEEFALYDQLLRELAAKANGVPIGTNPPPAADAAGRGAESGVDNVDAEEAVGRLRGMAPRPPAEPGFTVRFGAAAPNPNPTGARSIEYVQVLDKYLSRLAALNRSLDAVRVYRTEIDRNPTDQGLYERLAAFLEQNGVAREVENVYAQAIAKFAERSWYHKLARWYLRRRESAALEKISRDAIAVFSGTELERYFGEIVSSQLDAELYRQLNLYAHERFPEDLVFVHNLLGAYSRQETRDSAAAERLLRQYWFYDEHLRTMLFEQLSLQGRLYPELAQLRAANPGVVNGQFEQALAANPAAVQFAAEAETWLSHFEAAAPAERALANAYPGSSEFTTKASSLYRSLAAYEPRYTEIAVTLAGYEQRADPRNTSVLARMGDILADRELFTRARTYWERMPLAQPGKPEAWLDTATVYWDYYRYNDALRWISAARKKFDNGALFAYQAGAIDEGKRDYPAAVREYVAGALHGENSAGSRVLRLLNRPQTRDLIERATAAAVANDPSREALALRVSVLEAQQRRQDLEKLLEARVEAEKSVVELAGLQETARRLGFDRIEARANDRMAPLTNDPVDKMRLTLANVRLHESKKEIAEAGLVVDALYHDHPLILGVVRGAVDFHARNGQPDEAIDLLLDASKHARADLAAQFTLEAARTANEAGNVDRARTLLGGLLATDAFRAEYLTAMADTYLRVKDDSGFRDFELATIERLKQSSLTPAERLDRIATIRRSLIPALDRMKDYPGAVEQYIEVVNCYAEDEGLTKETAAYAMAHGQAGRLVAFYRKTIGESPLDYRWPIVLARIETVTEDFPSAIADYERAIRARPDRTDILEAKARLEERLMRFEDAIKSYGRLYELAYRDPQWLIKVAELHARLGQTAEVVTALRTAILGAKTETADADFAIAEQLEGWHILPDAVAFADRGANLAGANLFQGNEHATTYSRIMARARRMDVVLRGVLSNAGANPSVDGQVGPVAGSVVAETYTPEEKARLEQSLNAEAARVAPAVREARLLPLVTAAGLVDLESRWRHESMSAQSLRIDERWVALESQRGRYGELGRGLEEYAAKYPGQPVATPALVQSVQAFIAEGDIEGQMRVMRKAVSRDALSGPLLDRYLTLLVARQPEELVALARGNVVPEVRNRAVEIAIGSGRADLAYRLVASRGGALPAVWTRAYTALAGQYLDDRAPAIDAAFQAALDTRTIGERLRTPLKADSVIVGQVWFYYGARYGEYLGAGKSNAADGWLPASLEAAPGNPDAYVALGDWHAEAGQSAKAITQFEAALQLEADRGDAHDHIARVLWSEGRRTEAIAQWKTALSTFLRIQSRGVRVPEPFWRRVAETFTDIGERHAMGQLRGDVAHLLGDYYQRNNQYRLQELIEPAAHASIVSGEGTAWLVELGRSMDNPEMMLYTLMRIPGLTDAQRIELQRDQVALATKQAQAQFGDNRGYGETQATNYRVQLVSMLLNAGDVQGASAEWRLIPTVANRLRWGDYRFRDETEVRLASRTGALDRLLERYRTDPALSPSAENLRFAASTLRRDHDENGARAVLDFLYDREIRNGHLEASNFVGLAEVKLQQGDTATAITLLNRMALVVEDGFETLPAAADLLDKYGKNTEAADFLLRRVRAVPWDSAAKVHLARIMPAANTERERLLAAVVTDSQAAYKLRAESARLATGRGLAAPAGTELAVLSSATVSPDAAAKSYQVEARMEAARETFDAGVKFRLWQEALAIAPDDARVRLGALRAAIAAGRDSLALALEQAPKQSRLRSSAPPETQLSGQEQASIAEALAAAAERLDDLSSGESHLRVAIDLGSPDRRDGLRRRLDAIAAEQQRRAKNAARQPAVRNVIEQDHPVRPRILRSAQ